ncbi:MAG: Clp protease N-terminal domain-containing protein [Candidatus Eremiobacterota bacterium]
MLQVSLRPVDTIDLLAELVREPERELVDIFTAAGVNVPFLREQLSVRALGTSPRDVSVEIKGVLEKSFEVALDLGHTEVTMLHVLMAIVLSRCRALSYLGEAGADTDLLQREIHLRLRKA